VVLEQAQPVRGGATWLSAYAVGVRPTAFTGWTKRVSHSHPGWSSRGQVVTRPNLGWSRFLLNSTR